MRHLPLLALVGLLVGCGGNDASREGNDEATKTLEEADTAQCFAQRNAMIERTAQMARERAGPCTADADCTSVSLRLSCQDNCAGAVLASRAQELTAALEAYGAQVCPPKPNNCGISPGCPTLTPRCVSGVCEMQ